MNTYHGGIQYSDSPHPSIKKNGGPNNRRAVNIFALMFGLGALALLNTDIMTSGHRALAETADGVRKLCNTLFDYPDWEAYWEDLFSAPALYDGSGDQRASLPAFEEHNIGYFLTMMSCPGDDHGYTAEAKFDPGHAFYDAAAVLKHSITRNTYPVGSKYNATMYAIVHPNAVRCTSPNGAEYDRVKVLQDLGYAVIILGAPFPVIAVQDDYVRNNLATDIGGDYDFMRLFSLTFDNHPAIVLVDFTTLVIAPSDNVLDNFITSPNLKVSYSLDYATNLPAVAFSNSGPNMHWLLMKPDPLLFQALQDEYTTSTYSPVYGWNSQGVRDFDGVLSVKGFLAHYFTRNQPGGSIRVLDRCTHGNDNSDPYASDGVCRDPMDCSDCRVTNFDDIKVIKMIHTCGEPWKCSWNEDILDATTMAMCTLFHHAWFAERLDFEDSCWHNHPPSLRSGTFHPEIFLGFCSGPGALGYDRMIDDKFPALTPPITEPVPITLPAPIVAPECVTDKVSEYGIDTGCKAATPNCVAGVCEASNGVCPSAELSCGLLGCVLSGSTIGAGACIGDSACNEAAATIGAAACLGNDACWSATGLIGAASCVGDCACSNLKSGASIGARSCMGITACPYANSLVGADSCLGDRACSGTKAAVGAASCIGVSPCSDAAGVIGIGSCVGEFACANLKASASIGAGSCKAETACTKTNGLVGAGSCNGEGACEDAIANVGAGSCNAVDACQSSDGLIGAASCIGVGSCFGANSDIGAGSCTADGSCRNVIVTLMGATSCVGVDSCENAAGVIGIGSCTGKGSCMGTKADFNVAAGSCTGDYSCINASGVIAAGMCTTENSCSS